MKIIRKDKLKIFKNKPFIKACSNQGKTGRYPFGEMKKGDSFYVGIYDRYLQHQVGCLMRYFVKQNKLDWKFATRKTKTGKLQVFRIK